MKIARRDFVASLENGLGVIEAFDGRHPRLTLTEVAARTNMTRASARRYLLTLAKLGYADYDGKYFSLDLRVLRLGYGLLSAAPLSRKAQPVLDALALETGETASVAVLDEASVVFLARAHSRRLFSAVVGVGTRLPAFCLSTGRVLLAHKSDVEVRMLLGITPLTAFTDHTVTDTDTLMDIVRHTREEGYAISDQEFEIGLRSIAVAVPSVSGRNAAAITISAHASRMSIETMIDTLRAPLQRSADSLAAML